MMSDAMIVFCDNVRSVGVYNGNVRLALVRLDADGRSVPTIELIIPQTQVANMVRALQQVSR